jgi:phosphatidylglycerophosphate synthase
MTWRTKPTDRFVLRFIKTKLSAPVSLAIVRAVPGLPPSAVTLTGACLGVAGGILFGLGHAPGGSVLLAAAQIMDGVDGQVARLRKRVSSSGAFLDSVLDRVVDFVLLFGVLLFCLRNSAGLSLGDFVLTETWIIAITCLAAIGASQVSYTTARAAALNLDFRRPELAGKGTRTTVFILCGFLSTWWVHFPLIALIYTAVHPNLAMLLSLVRLRDGSRRSRNL